MSQLNTEGPKAKLLKPEQIRTVVTKLGLKIGLPQEDADILADAMTMAHLRGVDTHGIRSLVNYVNRYKAGSLNKTPQLKILKETPVSAVVDGDNGLGHIIGTKAMRLAIEKARKIGVGMVAMKNSNHFGAAAYFSMLAQKEGMIGFVSTNATPRMAPTGGKSAVYGNNPWSVALPYKEGSIPVVADMANSVVANSNINIAKKLGQKIPTTWALTADGLPTDDPNKAVLLQPFGGYKGYALSVLSEAFAAMLSGAEIGIDAGPFNTTKAGGQHIGHFFMALDPDIFAGKEVFEAKLDRFTSIIKCSELAEGSKGVFLPGEIEDDRLQDRLKNGIPVNQAFIDDLNVICEEFGVVERL